MQIVHQKMIVYLSTKVELLEFFWMMIEVKQITTPIHEIRKHFS